ncbi:RHS repeat protein [Salmonella enterica]|nr:RHS repeat protein [Salmonella enterica]
MTGNVLRTHGVDNGITVALNDAAGRPFMTVSNIGTADDGTEDASQAMTRTWQYEGVSLPGRPVGITEQVSGEAARITERFVWAGNSPEEKALNLAGQCVSHYDTAGYSRSAGRLSVLSLLATLSTIVLWLIGYHAENTGLHLRYQANSIKSRRVISYLTLAENVLRHSPLILKRTALDVVLHHLARTYRSMVLVY